MKSCIRGVIAAASAIGAFVVAMPANAGDLGTNAQVGAFAIVTHVSTKDFALRTAGAGVDVVFAALDGHKVVLDATLRRTRTNQFGLLGFGGAGARYTLTPELSAALWLNHGLLVGAEYRHKPSNLGALRENSIEDVFFAWAPVKNVSVTAAWTDLGSTAGKWTQRGVYLSLWLGY